MNSSDDVSDTDSRFAQGVADQGVSVRILVSELHAASIASTSASSIGVSGLGANAEKERARLLKKQTQLQAKIQQIERKLEPTHGFRLKASKDKILQEENVLAKLQQELNVLERLL